MKLCSLTCGVSVEKEIMGWDWIYVKIVFVVPDRSCLSLLLWSNPSELSLILGENRSCSVKAVVPTEIIVIKKKALEEILLSSNLELHKVIQAISKELAKKNDQKLPISYKDLLKLVEESPNVIKALSLQLHHRLTERIY